MLRRIARSAQSWIQQRTNPRTPQGAQHAQPHLSRSYYTDQHVPCFAITHPQDEPHTVLVQVTNNLNTLHLSQTALDAFLATLVDELQGADFQATLRPNSNDSPYSARVVAAITTHPTSRSMAQLRNALIEFLPINPEENTFPTYHNPNNPNSSLLNLGQEDACASCRRSPKHT